MDLDGEGMAARGLRRYVWLVAEAVGVGTEAAVVQLHDPLGAYLALDSRHAAYPDRDLALLWDERHGWALGLETDSDADVRVLGYLAVELLPPPRVVGTYVERICRGGETGPARPPSFGELPAVDLTDRLAAYAEPLRDDLSTFRLANLPPADLLTIAGVQRTHGGLVPPMARTEPGWPDSVQQLTKQLDETFPSVAVRKMA
jgi:hypothetical protein